jgi:hypothetical protein
MIILSVLLSVSPKNWEYFGRSKNEIEPRSRATTVGGRAQDNLGELGIIFGRLGVNETLYR